MSQYRTGTAKWLSATPNRIVLLQGTTTGTIGVGDLFFFDGEAASYIVASIIDSLTFTLTANYAGTKTADTYYAYVVVSDFTPEHDIAEMGIGDRDTPTVYTLGVRRIDNELGKRTAKFTNKTAGQLVLGDVVTVDASTDDAVGLGDTSASLQHYAVCLETTLASDAIGRFVIAGRVLVKAQGSIARKRYVRKSATAKAIEDAGAPMDATTLPPAGTIGVSQRAATGGFVWVLLFGWTDPGSASVTITGASGTFTNKTGTTLVATEVVAVDTDNDSAVDLGDTVGSLKNFAIWTDTSTAANATGRAMTDGGPVIAKAQGAITRGHYVKKSATTKAVETTGVLMDDTAGPPAGSIGVALTAAASSLVTILLFGFTRTPAAAQQGYILLPPSRAVMPDGSGSGNNYAAPRRRVSTGSQTTNSPKATGIVWDMDAGTDEHVLYDGLVVPGNYGSGGTLRVKFSMVSAVSGNVVVKAAVAPLTDDAAPGAAAVVFNTVATATVAVSGTAGRVKEATITLTMTGMAANRDYVLFIGRDADNASDTATGDLTYEGAILEYTPV